MCFLLLMSNGARFGLPHLCRPSASTRTSRPFPSCDGSPGAFGRSTENVDVTVVLYRDNGTSLSEFYYRMLPGANGGEACNRLFFEVKRD
jgi:hypothetical protein